jgi:hypothetical protein
MTMQSMMNAAPAPRQTKRFGLFPVKIGTTVLHRLGIDMPLEPPAHDARQYGKTSAKVRTKIRPTKPRYEMGVVAQGPHNVEVPVKALAGCPVYLEVQPFDRLDEDLRDHVKWSCNHPECAGKRWDTVEALQQEHEPDHILRKEAAQSPDGKPHMYMGVIEIAGVEGKPEEKNAEGKVTKKAVEPVLPVVMIVSNEE